MTAIQQLIGRLLRSGVLVSTDGKHLHLDGPQQHMTPLLLSEIKANKEALIAWLNTSRQSAQFFLEKAPAGEDHAVSSAQKRIWLLSQDANASRAYHITASFQISGSLDTDAVTKAFKLLVSRHESLRTTFFWTEEKGIRQRVADEHAIESNVCYIDVSAEANPPGMREHWLSLMQQEPFDLGKGPLVKAALIRQAPHLHYLFFSMHHIISDGWSMNILGKQFAEAYTALVSKVEFHFPSSLFTYTDFAYSQHNYCEREAGKKAREQWLRQLQRPAPEVDLPYITSRPARKTFNGAKQTRLISNAVLAPFEQLAAREGASLFTALLSAVNLLLFRYSGSTDQVLGTVWAGRELTELQDEVGCFAETLPLRTSFDRGYNFIALLKLVKDGFHELLPVSRYPFDRVLEELQISRDPSRSPLFDCWVVYHEKGMTGEMARLDMPGVEASVHQMPGGASSKFDLSFSFEATAPGLVFELEYNTDLFSAHLIDNMQRHFEALLWQVHTESQTPIGQLPLPAYEQQKLIDELNKTAAEFPADETLVSLFEKQAGSRPTATALLYEDVSITRQCLNETANKLANLLINEYSIQTGDAVALSINPGFEMVYSMLAVLKAGAAYVPIDPECPVERYKYILSNTGAKLLITNHDLPQEIVQQFGDKIIDWSTLNLDKADSTRPGGHVQPSDLAYIIYTSGSSGRPKGVEIPHRGAVNRIHWMHRHYSFSEADVILQKTAYTFDVSVWEFFLSLCFGCPLVLCRKELTRDPSLIISACAQYKITTMHFVPTMYDAMLAFLQPVHKSSLASLRHLFTSGEALLPHAVQAHYAYFNIPLHNLYGPTEASVDVTYFETHAGDRVIPIGKPIYNTSIYILDKELGLVPEGVAGQIAIGGIGVARGYRNSPELSAEKFIKEPFKEKGLIYLTGDLGRWGSGGQLEYLGRQDDQVKIKGFRVEPAEVENLLLQFPYVTGASVVAKDTRLLAFYTGEQLPEAARMFTSYLLRYIPEYMVPAQFTWLEALPRTSSGKVNRKELLKYELPDDSAVVNIPATAAEEKLLQIWHEVLQGNQRGTLDNFFLSGGDSIKAIKLIARINKEWGLSMQLQDLYQYPSIQAFAGAIGQHRAVEDPALKTASQTIAALQAAITQDQNFNQAFPSPPEDIYPMSDIQKGIIYYNLLGQDAALYQDQFFYQFRDETYDHARIEKAIALLVEKHPILRTNFFLTGFSEPVQVVRNFTSKREWSYYEDITGNNKEEKTQYLLQLMIALRRKDFDIREGALWQVRVFRLDKHEYGMLLVFHHAIMDGWSISVFLTELYQLYTELKTKAIAALPPLKTNYKQYILDQLAVAADPVTKDFWNKMLKDCPSPSLPFGKSRAAGLQERASWRYTVDGELLNAIYKLSAAHSVAIKDIFAAALGLTLQYTTGEHDIVWGMVTHGRPTLEDSEKVLGCFLNSIPFRVFIDLDQTAGDFLATVAKQLTAIKPYEKLSLNAIVQNLGQGFSLTNPLFDVLLNFVDFHLLNELESGLEVLEPLVASYENNNTLLDFQINRIHDRLEIAVNYQESYFTLTEAARLGSYFVTALQQLTRVPAELPLHKLSLLVEEEIQVLHRLMNVIPYALPAATVNELWAAMVQKHANRAIVHCNDRSLTYAQLNAQSNKLAALLLANHNITGGDTIALLMERSEWLVIAMLAIWKTGAVYVPVDIAFPVDRKKYILEDAAVKLILTDEFERVAPFGIDAVIPARSVMENDALISPDDTLAHDVAYIIYTSGSTGKPKGVAVTQSNLVNFIGGMDQALRLSDSNHLLAITTVAFDISILELIWTLLRGIAITIKKDAEERTGFNRYALVDSLQVTPSFLRLLLADDHSAGFIRSLKYLIIGGEPLDPPLVELTRQRTNAVIYNVYGPTETTIWSSVKELAPGMPVTVGRPIVNTSFYIMDDDGRLLPPGTDGELCIGGYGVAKEYINRPELTTEKFLRDERAPGGGRLYRTGDIGRWNPEGEMIVKGRKDRQLKINGYRIEPGEIEAALLELPGIQQAVVWNTAEPESVLAACYVSNTNLNSKQVRERISALLPAYMIPSSFTCLDELPLLPSGKTDLAAIRRLANQQLRTGTAETAAPRPSLITGKDEVVKGITGIWKDLFPHEDPKPDDNFFALGGNSMLIIRLHEALNIAYPQSIRISDLFDHSTIAAQAVLIGGATGHASNRKDRFELLDL